VKLTQSKVNSLALPADRTEVIYFDNDLPGFGLRLRANSKPVYIYQYQLASKQRRMTLGATAAITLATARKTAGELHARVRLQEDPAAQRDERRRSAANTFESMLRIYLPEKKQTLRPTSYRGVARHLQTYAKLLHPLGIKSVTRRDIATVLTQVTGISGAMSANRTRSSLSAFFSWCMTRDLIEANPVIGTSVAPEKSRERVLTMPELAAVWRACGDDAYGTIVRMLMLTGQRREEIGGLRWDEVHDDAIALPGERTKNRRAHVIPLSDLAHNIIAAQPRRTGEFVFGAQFVSWAYGKKQLDGRLNLDHWTIHDIRRSVATGMAEIGVQPHIVEAVLNHASGHKAGVAGIYNRASYEREKRTALALWADHVLATVEGRAPKVIPLRA
jgi:integrase